MIYQGLIDQQVIGQKDEENRQADYEIGQAASVEKFGGGETSQSQEDVDDLDGSRDVLRIIPTNSKAQSAFHELALKTQYNSLDKHHVNFLVVEGKKLASTSEGYDPRTSEGETTVAESSQDSKPEELIYHGYFRINLDYHPTFLGAKWIIGSGTTRGGPTRGVDILLAAPDSKHRKGLASAHAFLTMHQLSGAWMIRAGQICGHVKENVPEVIDSANGFLRCQHNSPVWCDKQSLRHAASRCLSRPRTSIKIAGMHYDVEFCIDTSEKEINYVKDRNGFLTTQGIPFPKTHISAIPFEPDIKTRWAVFRQGLGSGSFGTVFEGFDPETGDLRAVKKLVIKTSDTVAMIKEEIEANEHLTGRDGIVTTYGWCNSSGEQSFKGVYPMEMYTFQEKGIAFNQVKWKHSSCMDWTLRKRLCRQLLEGVRAIHASGWMHRDITPQNILYFPTDPKHAALCDFGKLCWERTSTLETLAAWIFLPPEIQPHKGYKYDQSIDIWMLGYALLWVWFPEIAPKKKEEEAMRDWRKHPKVLSRLAADENSKEPSFCVLLGKMLSWDAKTRPSADQALAHPSLNGLDPDRKPKSNSKGQKRSHD